jgi:probable rRNA maturation factor
MTFTVYCDEFEEISKEALTALEGAMKGFVQADVGLAIELLFVDEEEIQRLNRETRNMDKVTDVLSYPYIENPCSPFTKSKYPFEYNARSKAVELGCIAVCTSYIERAAKEDQTVYVKDVYRAFTHVKFLRRITHGRFVFYDIRSQALTALFITENDHILSFLLKYCKKFAILSYAEKLSIRTGAFK